MASSTLEKTTTTRRTGLSDLPDEIIVNILSLLPIKSAVATSLLSRRWRYLWTCITNLKLSEDMFKERSQFINFVNRAMVVRKGSSLESFSLQFQVFTNNNASRLNAWITSAIQCNVENLTLQIDTVMVESGLPVCLFGCQSLVKFDLTMGYSIPRVPSSSTSVFSNHKSLRLCEVRFADGESAQKLLSSPLLEELIIKRCMWHRVKAINVFTPNLKVLDIEDHTSPTNYYIDKNSKACFVADKLWSFRFSGSLYYGFQICASSSMQFSTAEIYVHRGPDMDALLFAIRHLKLINGLSKAHTLTLTDCFLRTLEGILEQLDKMPVFECLTRLNLEFVLNAIHIDHIVLMKILKKCPHLERLDIAKLRNVVMVSELSPDIMCFRTHLKRIYIGSTYHAEKGDAISALLNSCTVLEIMAINRLLVHERYGGSMNIEELQNELNRRPRVSKDCRIVLKHADSYNDESMIFI